MNIKYIYIYQNINNLNKYSMYDKIFEKNFAKFE